MAAAGVGGGTYAGRAAVAIVAAAADTAAFAAAGAAAAASEMVATVEPQCTQNFAPGGISLLQVVHFIAVLRLHSRRWTPSRSGTIVLRGH